MKFRTDFVTNSSSSSFLTFNIKNKRLFEALTNLGIRFNNVPNGEFSGAMEIVLPSGESSDEDEFDASENGGLPDPSDTGSISAWLVAMILWEVESKKEKDEYSNFAKELIQLLNDADITHLDWEAVERWSRDAMMDDLESAFGKMDGDIESATIEHTYGYEVVVGPCIYTEVKDGKRMDVNYSNTEGIEREECDGLKFVVTGKLKHFENRDELVELIEDLGGTITDNVTKNTDYLICNDVKSTSSKMKKAKELGIPVLSEVGFIRRFSDPEKFDDIPDESSLAKDAWHMTYGGGVLDFVMNNGTQPIKMRVWKDGKWVRGISEQKQAFQTAAKEAKNEASKSVMATVFGMDNGSLKRLLLIPSRDCLTSDDTTACDKPFDKLCEEGVFRFEIGPVDAFEASNCYIVAEKETSKSLFGEMQTQLTFTVICKAEFCDLNEFKVRPIEICNVLNSIVNGKDIPGIGKVSYMMCKPRPISDDYFSCTIWFSVDNDLYSRNNSVNALDRYNEDSKAIIEELLKDNELKSLLQVQELPDEQILNDGFILSWESLGKNLDKGYKSWIIVSWNFSRGTSVSVVTICRKDSRKLDSGADRLKELTSIIQSRLSEFSLPARGKLNFKESYSQAEMKLSDDLVASMLAFTAEQGYRVE